VTAAHSVCISFGVTLEKAKFMNNNGLYSGYSPLAKMNLNNIMEPLAEVDGFEPQTRARSNTWPLPRPENFVDPEEGAQGGGGGAPEGGNKCPVPVS